MDWFFTCEQWGGEVSIPEPHKCAALEWFRDNDGVGILAEGFAD